MKNLFAILLSILLATEALAVTEDQFEIITYEVATGTQAKTFVTPPTAGCTMVVAGSFAGDSVDMAFGSPVVQDTDSNTYTAIQSTNAGFQVALIAVAHLTSVTAPFTVSINIPAVTNYASVAFKSFCGLANPALNVSATAADPGPQASDATVSTATTTQANATIIAVLGICVAGDSNATITGPTTGYTEIYVEQDCTAAQGGKISWKNVTTQGVQSATWSHDDVTGSGGYNGWATAIAALKDAVPGGAVAARRRSAVVVQ